MKVEGDKIMIFTCGMYPVLGLAEPNFPVILYYQSLVLQTLETPGSILHTVSLHMPVTADVKHLLPAKTATGFPCTLYCFCNTELKTIHNTAMNRFQYGPFAFYHRYFQDVRTVKKYFC
jgi:hypothetical protein